MGAATLIGKFLVFSTLAGILGAGAMGLVLWGFTRSKIANANMVLAVGSLLTRSYERAFQVGIFVHLAAGVFFAEIYAVILVAIGHPGIGTNLVWGAGLGMFHGLMMSLILIAAVADAHPLEEFQQRSFSIALSHWVGHVAYGIVVGTVIGASGLIVAGA